MTLYVGNAPAVKLYNPVVVDNYLSESVKKVCTTITQKIEQDLQQGTGFHAIAKKYTAKELNSEIKSLDKCTKEAYEQLLAVTIKCIEQTEKYFLLKDMVNSIGKDLGAQDVASQFLSSLVYSEIKPLVNRLQLFDPEALKNV
jgi:hypothetical protein